jgi:hypothetical protein
MTFLLKKLKYVMRLQKKVRLGHLLELGIFPFISFEYLYRMWIVSSLHIKFFPGFFKIYKQTSIQQLRFISYTVLTKMPRSPYARGYDDVPVATTTTTTGTTTDIKSTK